MLENEVPFILKDPAVGRDDDGVEIKGRILINASSIEILLDGYGEYNAEVGQGAVALLEIWEKQILLHANADITREGPTQSIVLNDASEARRTN